MDFGLSQCRSEQPMQLGKQPTVLERLMVQRESYAERLAEIDKLVDLLKKYPEMEQAFTAMSRLL